LFGTPICLSHYSSTPTASKFEQLEIAWVSAQQGDSKSIPLQFFRDHCARIRSGIYTVHYLEAVGVDE